MPGKFSKILTLFLPGIFLLGFNIGIGSVTAMAKAGATYGISLLGLVVPIFEARPVFVMIVSQAFNSVILPVTVACILYLGNRRDLMGTHRNSAAANLILATILLFSLVTSSMGIRGVWQIISA